MITHNKKRAFMLSSAMKHVILLSISIFTVFPFLWMMSGALKTKDEVMNPHNFLPAQPVWENMTQVLFESPVLRYIGNSFFVAICIALLQLVTASLFAYAVTFFKFRGKNTLFCIVFATYLVPSAATYIPGYLILANLNLLNTYRGLILSNAVSMFGIFLLRQAFMQIPYGMVEAAKIDGASHLKILTRVVIPVTKPTIATMLLLSFIGSYNSYMWPSLITDDPKLSLVSQGLRRFLYEGGAYGTEWALVMAASTAAVLPLLLLFFRTQKWIMPGITDTGMKG